LGEEVLGEEPWPWLLRRLAPATPTPTTSSIARMMIGYGLRLCCGIP
jgi:hypothetical protein